MLVQINPMRAIVHQFKTSYFIIKEHNKQHYNTLEGFPFFFKDTKDQQPVVIPSFYLPPDNWHVLSMAVYLTSLANSF